MAAFKRILLKLSGEALAGDKPFGIDPDRMGELAEEISQVHSLGVETALVLGGGNFFRGVAQQAKHMDRVAADQIGMLATVMNGLAMQDALEGRGMKTRLMSALQMHQVAEPFIRRRAMRHLEKGRVVVFVGGTGSPYFSTDTGAALRAMEVKADVILKGTKVDGVYDADPQLVKTALRFETIGYQEFIERGLRVMDISAVSMCKDNNMPVIVFNLRRPGNIRRVVMGEKVGSRIGSAEPAVAGSL
jgi:uridylate kinase